MSETNSQKRQRVRQTPDSLIDDITTRLTEMKNRLEKTLKKVEGAKP